MSPIATGGESGKISSTLSTAVRMKAMVSVVPSDSAGRRTSQPGPAGMTVPLRRMPPEGDPMDKDPREAGSASIRDRNSSSSRASRAACESGTGRACGAVPASGGVLA